MEAINYFDFDVHIERLESGYRVRVTNSPVGQAEALFDLPFSELEVENFVLKVGRTRRGVRRLESPEMEAARKFGGGLFESVFRDEIRGRLRSSMNEARQKKAGLRMRLHLMDVPELAELPWEYLYDRTLDQFLILSVNTPIVRYLDLPINTAPLTVNLPLKVLVMISSPSDYPTLDVEKEYNNLVQGLSDLEQRGLLKLDRLEKATLSNLQRQLRREEYHIFHFIGHGGYDEQSQDGVLLLEDENERGRPVSGRFLGTMLHDQQSLRLALLNACEGARTSRSDPFSGVAHSLVQKGIPAVIAMQFEITDEAAIVLAHEFYGAVADGFPVDAALAEARKAVFADNNDIEWGTPVLYMRSPDGRVFGVERLPQQAIPTLQGKPEIVETSPRPLHPEQKISAPAIPVTGQGLPLEAATLAGAVPAPVESAPPARQATRGADSHALEHREGHGHSHFPWAAAVIGALVLGVVLLFALGVIDPASISGILSRQSAGPATQIAFIPPDTLEPAPPATDTQLAPTNTEAATEAVVAPVAPATETPTFEPSATGTPTLEPSPTETPTTGPTSVGGGSGQIAFASNRGGAPQVWLVNADGNDPQQLTNRPGGACQPAWSTDGDQLVFISPCSRNQESYPTSALYIINADGSGEFQLTDGIDGDYEPSWAPNSKIVFTSERGDFTGIWVIDPAIRGEPVRLTGDSYCKEPDWSPDGTQIVFTSSRLGTWHIFTMPIAGERAAGGSRAKQFSRQNEFNYANPRYSVDGTNLIFMKLNPNGSQHGLFGSKVADIGLKEYLVGTAQDKSPIQGADYSPDGKWIVYEGWPDGSNHDIWIMTSNGAERSRVTVEEGHDFDPAWRP